MGWLALALDLANLIPFRFRGTRSDGAYLLDAMRSRAPGVGEWDDEIEAIVSRGSCSPRTSAEPSRLATGTSSAA
jgi:hypothetical protein